MDTGYDLSYVQRRVGELMNATLFKHEQITAAERFHYQIFDNRPLLKFLRYRVPRNHPESYRDGLPTHAR